VKRTSILVTFLAAVTLLSTSCGTSDKLASVSLNVSGNTGTVNLAGLGGTLQLQVLTNYTSGKQVDETNWSTYAITPQGVDDSGIALPTPPQGMTINATGMVTATEPGICTWVDVNSSGTGSPAWAFTGFYQIIATYKGMQSQPVYIPVASAASSQSITEGQCGPSSTGG
jgi:hypothetical protein